MCHAKETGPAKLRILVSAIPPAERGRARKGWKGENRPRGRPRMSRTSLYAPLFGIELE